MRPHRTDRVALVAGLVFLAAAAAWLVVRVLALPGVAVLGICTGTVLVLIGIGIAAMIRRSQAPTDGD